jgi:hypothetical protein
MKEKEGFRAVEKYLTDTPCVLYMLRCKPAAVGWPYTRKGLKYIWNMIYSLVGECKESQAMANYWFKEKD